MSATEENRWMPDLCTIISLLYVCCCDWFLAYVCLLHIRERKSRHLHCSCLALSSSACVAVGLFVFVHHYHCSNTVVVSVLVFFLWKVMHQNHRSGSLVLSVVCCVFCYCVRPCYVSCCCFC